MTDFDPIAYINEPRWQESRLGLERTHDLLNRMGRPQDKLKFVHVAGTNGKGSTCAYLESILRTAGYKTGLFTSPYILVFEERIRVNGENISFEDLRDVTLFVKEHAEAFAQETGEHPTEFELMTAVAFEHFARSGCDIVVCEVGLGGRLDSTNVIAAPEACVITRIGLDHTDMLGNTLAEVAGEKAGIIKPPSPVVVYPQDATEAEEAIRAKAAECGCSVFAPDFDQLVVGRVNAEGLREFNYKGDSYRTRLLGSYQPYNAAMAIEVAQVLDSAAKAGAGAFAVDGKSIADGIEQTVWPGRFELVEAGQGCAAVVVDGGHNPQGAEVLAQSLSDVFHDKRIVFLMSVLADKDYRTMIRTVAPLGSAWVCVTSPNVGRALSGDDLAKAVREEADKIGLNGMSVTVAPNFSAAMQQAKELAGEEGVVCAWGSLYSLSNLRDALDL